MFQQKSTETVTLTKTQLQAILELMTQIGGIKQSDAWDEPKANYANDNKLSYNFDNKLSQNYNTNDKQLFSRNNYWEREREDMLERDDWYSLKNDREPNNSYAPLLMVNNNQFSNELMSPTVSNSIKNCDSRANSVMASETSNESNFRRYARINDSEFDLNVLQQKRIKALEYRRALAQQKDENIRKRVEEKEKFRKEEELLEKRIRDERIRMKNDFEREQKLIQQKQEIAQRKREAVIAAIERTPVIKKKDFLVEKRSEDTSCSQQSVVAVAAIRPQTRTKETFVQTDQQIFSSQNCDIGTQTDVQLLLLLLKEMNYPSKEKPLFDSKETKSSDSSSSTRTPTPKISKKWDENHKIKLLPNRPVFGTNQQNKSFVKYPNHRSQETRKKFKEKEIMNHIKNQTKDENQEKDRISFQQNKAKLSEEAEQQPLSRPLRRSSLNLSLSAKNLSEYNNQKRLSVDQKIKLNFLPEISSRPHSRKKWFSQQTFNPNLLT